MIVTADVAGVPLLGHKRPNTTIGKPAPPGSTSGDPSLT